MDDQGEDSLQETYTGDTIHAGESDPEKPDWYWRGLGYDSEHPRASHEEAPADAEPVGGADGPEEEDAQGDSGDEDASEEIAKPMVLRYPGQMTAQEYDDHCAAGHVPWRSNCASCVAGMATQDPHRAKKEKGALPELAYDYAYLNPKDEERVRRGEKRPEDLTRLLIGKEEPKYGAHFAHLIPRKG